MIDIFEGYREEKRKKLENGNYRVAITEIEQTTSKAGNPMLVITVQPNGTQMHIKHYIVKNDYFNANMTEFFESFGIDHNDHNILGWVGAIGAAKLVEDENGYMKVKYFLDQDKQDKLPIWEGTPPTRQTVGSVPLMDDEEDLPF